MSPEGRHTSALPSLTPYRLPFVICSVTGFSWPHVCPGMDQVEISILWRLPRKPECRTSRSPAYLLLTWTAASRKWVPADPGAVVQLLRNTLAILYHLTVSSDHIFPPPSSVYDQKDPYCWFWLILSHFNRPCQRSYTHVMVWNQNSSTHVLVNETKISAAHFLVLTLMAGSPCSLDKHTGHEIWSIFSSYLQGM